MKELKRILQVEDDQDILDIAALSLELVGGYELQQFSKGMDAVKHAAEHDPDLFLLDVMMPGIGGIETLRGLRQIPQLQAIPAIFMTAKNLSEINVDTDLGQHVIGVIEKPFDTIQLPETIREMWAEYQGQ